MNLLPYEFSSSTKEAETGSYLFYYFQASLVYIASSRSAKAAQQNLSQRRGEVGGGEK